MQGCANPPATNDERMVRANARSTKSGQQCNVTERQCARTRIVIRHSLIQPGYLTLAYNLGFTAGLSSPLSSLHIR